MTSQSGVVRWHALGRERLPEFLAKGHRERSFFPHRFLFLPRPGPDGYKLAVRMCGDPEGAQLWELALFADEQMLDEFPRELFFDPEIAWHGQHFGRPGHIAYADVVVRGDEMWSMSHVSDVVQRIGRRREHKTRIENRFKGWPDMVVNALLAFAVERGLRRLHIPSSSFQMEHTDRKRVVQPELFERVYDRAVNRLLRVRRAGAWWAVDVEENRDRLVQPTVEEDRLEPRPTVCLCHDIEAGLGHVGIDERRAALADRSWRQNVAAMLEREAAAGVRATYNVVGQLLDEVRPEIEAGGHGIAFHSYDHRPPEATAADGSFDQLSACRRIDYRLRGYRVPRSKLTPELTNANLLFHNFEWLASSVASLGRDQPALDNGVVWIPVHRDDFDLYRRGEPFEGWEARTFERLHGHSIAVVSLHDCYAELWLGQYDRLLGELGDLGELRTLDEVSADVVLGASV